MPTDFSKQSVCLFFGVIQGRSLANKISGKKYKSRSWRTVSWPQNEFSRAQRSVLAGLYMAAPRDRVSVLVNTKRNGSGQALSWLPSCMMFKYNILNRPTMLPSPEMFICLLYYRDFPMTPHAGTQGEGYQGLCPFLFFPLFNSKCSIFGLSGISH